MCIRDSRVPAEQRLRVPAHVRRRAVIGKEGEDEGEDRCALQLRAPVAAAPTLARCGNPSPVLLSYLPPCGEQGAAARLSWRIAGSACVLCVRVCIFLHKCRI
eukprot:3904046-Rhodomonas_salina.1